jgi:hypothetical protein
MWEFFCSLGNLIKDKVFIRVSLEVLCLSELRQKRNFLERYKLVFIIKGKAQKKKSNMEICHDNYYFPHEARKASQARISVCLCYITTFYILNEPSVIPRTIPIFVPSKLVLTG